MFLDEAAADANDPHQDPVPVPQNMIEMIVGQRENQNVNDDQGPSLDHAPQPQPDLHQDQCRDLNLQQVKEQNKKMNVKGAAGLLPQNRCTNKIQCFEMRMLDDRKHWHKTQKVTYG